MLPLAYLLGYGATVILFAALGVTVGELVRGITRRFRKLKQMNWRVIACVLAILSELPSVAVTSSIRRDDGQSPGRLVRVEAVAIR